MDSFELNKIAAAVLGSCLLLLVINEVGKAIVHPHKLEKSVLAIDTGAAEPKEAVAEAEEEKPLAVLLASADPAKGEKIAKKCGACHTFDKGGANKVGPHLYGVLGREKASVDFNYSDALKGMGGTWSYADIAHFVTNPKDFAPGTKMAFAGIKKAEDRADLLAYLRQQNDAPPPLPTE